ncbi:glycosyltransferase family 2 protein [Methylomagnum sp.]
MATEFRPCLLIPVYNHERPLPDIVACLKFHGIPLMLIDDGSEASCAKVIQDLAENQPWITLIRHPENQGKGRAVKNGLLAAQESGYTHVLQIDADGQHDLADLDKFLAVAQSNPEAMIVGQPIFDESVPKSRYYGRLLTHVWVWINTLSLETKDALCGYRVYPVESAANLINSVTLGDRMEFDVEVVIRLCWRGVRVISMPTRVTYPKDGISHFRLWEDNLLLSKMQARMFFGMWPRIPFLIARHFR